MRERSIHPRVRVLSRLLALLVGGLLVASVGAADPKDRVAVGKVVSPDGTVLQRPAGEKKFVPLKTGAPVYSSDLTLGQVGSVIESKDGAVQLKLLADLLGNSPHPILEAAVELRPPSKDVDLNFVLDRGRVALTNQKKEGAAHVRVHFRDQTWDVTLEEPNTFVALELYGRWPRGVFWHKKTSAKEEPTAVAVLLVLRGSIALKHGSHHHALKAPPGPALFQWDSVGGEDTGPKRLEELPAWADPEANKSEMKKLAPQREQMREWVLKHGLEGAAEKAIASDDEVLRHIGVIILGATDNLNGLGEALSNSKHADVRENAVLVLRHWIGRSPGQDTRLYDLLTSEKKLTPAQAESVVNLLHSFGPSELARPETWETLIEYLRHDKLPIRELAAFHLYRLVPDAKDIKYNPAGTKEEREAAYKEWKKRIPEGEVPKKAKAKEDK